MIINFRDIKFRIVYWIVSKLDKFKEVFFMNYGFHDPDNIISIDSVDEQNRYCIQLYRHLADQVELTNKDIVEIGSGRGGGLASLAKYKSPTSLLGIDLCKSSVDFSNKQYHYNNLSFKHGNAQQIPLKENSCDVVINVESSHRYLEMDRFLSEVKRILKTGGNFLFTDFRFNHEWDDLHKLFESFGFKILFKQDITSKVVDALNLDDHRRRSLVKKLAPKYIQKAMLNFAGAIDSETYRYFFNRHYVYYSYVFQKV